MTVTERSRLECPLSAWTGTPGNCQWCDKPIPPGRRRTFDTDACRRAWERNHLWRRARIYARKRAKYVCCRPGCTAERRNIEINHIDPLAGTGASYSVPSCAHHQENLEALCPAHHLIETNRQRAERAAARAAAQELAQGAA